MTIKKFKKFVFYEENDICLMCFIPRFYQSEESSGIVEILPI